MNGKFNGYFTLNLIIIEYWFLNIFEYSYFQIASDFSGKLEERGRGHAAVNPLHENSGADGLRHWPKFRFVRFSGFPVTSDLPCKSRCKPRTYFRRNGVCPHFWQVVVFFRRSSVQLNLIISIRICKVQELRIYEMYD